jgi:hypothetical protein
MCFVGALWIVGALAYWLGYDFEVVWLTALIGSGVAVAEWRLARRQSVSPGDNHD